MTGQNPISAKFILTLFLTLVLFFTYPASAQNTTIVFDMDDSGNAKMALTESLDMIFDSMSVFASVDKGNILTFSGNLADSTDSDSADYDIKLTVTPTSADATFSMWGADISDILAETGDFDLQVDLIEDNGALDVSLIANVQRAYLEDALLIDIEKLQQDPYVASELEDEINLALSAYQLPVDTSVKIENFEITGDDELTLTVDMVLEGWSELMAYSASLEYQQDTDSVDFVNCVGLTTEDVVYGLLNSESNNKLTLTASGDMISGTLSSTSPQGTFSDSLIAGLEVKLSKSGEKTSLSGYVTLSDAPTFISCLMRDFVPSGTVDSLDYALTSSDNQVTSTIEAKVSDMAVEKDGTLSVSFPKEATEEANVTIKVPSDMEITSAKGGIIEDGVAKSTPGEALSVTYAQKGGLDTTLIILIVIVVLILLLLMRRKKE